MGLGSSWMDTPWINLNSPAIGSGLTISEEVLDLNPSLKCEETLDPRCFSAVSGRLVYPIRTNHSATKSVCHDEWIVHFQYECPLVSIIFSLIAFTDLPFIPTNVSIPLSNHQFKFQGISYIKGIRVWTTEALGEKSALGKSLKSFWALRIPRYTCEPFGIQLNVFEVQP